MIFSPRFVGILILFWLSITLGLKRSVKRRAYRALRDRIGVDLVQWTDSRRIALPKSDPVEGKNPACEEIRMSFIATPETTSHVQQIIATSQEFAIPLCTKSGGHSYTCASVDDECLQLDLKLMKDSVVEVDDNGRHYLRFGTGNRGLDLFQVAPKLNYSYVHGECDQVGTGGFFLHGGVHLGYESAKHGIGADNVQEMEVVFANKTVSYISRTENPDLLHAMTRAGSSFGIVTEIKIEIFPLLASEAPTVPWLIPILNWDYTVDDVIFLWELIWDLKRSGQHPDFQVNFWIQSNRLAPPSLQISYLGSDPDKQADSFQTCADWIEENLGITVGRLGKTVAKVVDSLWSTDAGFQNLAVGYHIQIPDSTHWTFPALKGLYRAEPYQSSSYIGAANNATTEMFRIYVNKAYETKRPRCLLLINMISVSRSEWLEKNVKSVDGVGCGDSIQDCFVSALDYTCFGDYQHLSDETTLDLRNSFPNKGDYFRYYNIPSKKDSKCRYWPDYSELSRVKQIVDPDNFFDISQGIHHSFQSRFQGQGEDDCDDDLNKEE